MAAAVLAANPHDTQPWLFRVTRDEIEVFADLSRHLGSMDAFVREMHLGIGCAIQNALLAAAVNGFEAEVEAVPGSLLNIRERNGLVPAARLRLSRTKPGAPSSLYRVIPERHTNRYAYDRAKALPADWLDFARHANESDDVRVYVFTQGGARREFDAAVIDATQAIVNDNVMSTDNLRWMRRSRDAIKSHRDGLTYASAGLSSFMQFLAGLIALPPHMESETWLAQTRDTHLATAPVTGLIAVRDRYDRASALSAGRTWQRLHLSAVVRGIAMQPLNQPLEMVDRERQLGRGDAWSSRMASLTGPEWQATFAFRAGCSDETAAPSPRRALKDVVRFAG